MSIHSAELNQARIDGLQVDIDGLEREVQALGPRLRWMRWLNNAFIVAALAGAFAVVEDHIVLSEFQITCVFVISVIVFPVGQGGDMELSLKKSELRVLRSELRFGQMALELHQRTESTPPDGNVNVWRSADNGRLELVAAELGDGSKTVELVRWFVDVGDRVAPKQPVADVMYDLWTIEIPSQANGVIEELCLGLGEGAAMGATLCVMRTDPTDDHAATH